MPDEVIDAAANAAAGASQSAPAATGNAGENTDSNSAAGSASNAEGGANTPPVFDQNYVSGLRDEAGNYRTQRNEARSQLEATAAERDQIKTQLESILDGLGKLSGAKADEPADPQDVIAQLTAERDSTAAERDADRKALRALRQRDAVSTAAAAHGGSVADLLDSSSVLSKVDALDTAADDYATQVDALILAEIQANPKFAAGPALASSSTGDSNQGTTEQKLTLDDLKKMSDEEKLKAAKDGRLKHLLAPGA